MSMDESSIVQPETSTTTPDSDIKGGIESTYREFAPLYKHFDIDKSDKADEALNEIWEYAKSQSSEKDKDSIILQVIKFNNELGNPGLGSAPYSKMRDYIRVFKQFKEAGELMDKLKK